MDRDSQFEGCRDMRGRSEVQPQGQDKLLIGLCDVPCFFQTERSEVPAVETHVKQEEGTVLRGSVAGKAPAAIAIALRLLESARWTVRNHVSPVV